MNNENNKKFFGGPDATRAIFQKSPLVAEGMVKKNIDYTIFSGAAGLTKRSNGAILTPGVIMRLTEVEVSAIKQSVRAFDPEAKIFLFGSRVDDKRKGGDIDLFVLSRKIKSRERRRIKLNLYDSIGEQKIDMVVTPKITTAFHRIAVSTGVEL